MSDRILVTTRKGLFTVERRGAGEWAIVRSAFLGDRATMALADPRDKTVYAALDLGHFGVKLHRSENGGESWEEIAAPAYPKQEEEEEGKKAPSVNLIWALEAGGSDQPGVLWAGTLPGGLFRSGDGGATWHLNQPLWERPERANWFGGGYDEPGIHSICVDPRDSRRLVLGVSCGGVWVTGDGGETWDCNGKGMFAEYMPPERREDPTIQDPHRLMQCKANPDALWVQHHNGVFRSTDGAATWQPIPDVKPSVFGFAVAAHPEDPETAWFVPAVKDECRIPVGGRLVVSRTKNGGESFQVLGEGLPQEHAYDLVYRHGLDVDSTGNRLVLGSTTGGLWVSENQGDSWICVASHLPPVYCVRFTG